MPAGRDYVLIARPQLGEALAGHDADWLGERVDEVLGKGDRMRYLSLLVRAFFPTPGVAGAPVCKYHPTCSQYSSLAYREYGLVRGNLDDGLAPAPLQPVEPRRGRLPREAETPAVIVAGVLTPIENALAWLLEHLHDSLGLSWGWSIIALTIIVRVALVPLMVKQIHSTQAMQIHMPEMKAIQQKYKGDRQRTERGDDEVLQGEQHQPGGTVPAAAGAVPDLLRAVLRAEELHEARRRRLPHELGWLIVPNITHKITSHWSGYVLLVVYVVSQVVVGLLRVRRPRSAASGSC